ncbi:hypothetical protein JMJ55_28110 [Belnapia sp. T6]|uniref:Uncharacterized protein n=1 Tax=Belnapia mucosa TaxID=2804532 RepID=A0ABS1VC44_9PROT|nr:hypothetical protein [Belnapia mucosa]MBL6459192.1 hypothetical protein [Belnapia mucosa]
MKRYFTPSSEVERIAAGLREKYRIVPERTLAVCYRGTDKDREVKPVDPAEYLAAGRHLLETVLFDRVYVQTDQQQVRDFLMNGFGDLAFFVEEMPVTSTTHAAIHRMNIEAKMGLDRTEFGRRLVAAVSIMSSCAAVVTHTGKVGLRTSLEQGKADGLYQFTKNQSLDPALPSEAPAVI